MNWSDFITSEAQKEYFQKLSEFVRQERISKTIYPQEEQVFTAFDLCPYDQIKAVILGQDPYHGPNQAHGLSFSVQEGVAIPPSLRNIFAELNSDFGQNHQFAHGNLSAWAKQGVFLLNATLTVEAGKPASHVGQGWEIFTDYVIDVLNDHSEKLVFILWGKNARQKKDRIDGSKHLILESAHPSPFSAHYGFFGSKPFSKTNQFLTENGKEPIYWFTK